MNTPYEAWTATYPDAAAALVRTFTVDMSARAAGGSEASVQQKTRLQIAQQGGHAWRNNVGATPARCPDCGVRQRVVRYGLANDSQQLNRRIKSSDLILAVPRQITSDMVGTVIAQFGAVECKRPGWTYCNKEREAGQAAWLALISALGGFARFSTGEIVL